MRLGPDERTYLAQARVWSATGVRGLRALVIQYLACLGARDYPSPIRWGWTLALRVSERAALFFTFVCVGLTFAASPLLVHLARRRLQDTAVAALTLASLVAANVHGSVGLAIAFAGLLAVKPEGAALAVPAIAWAWGAVPGPALPLMVGAMVWAVATVYLFRGYAWILVRAIVQPHSNAYGLEHQRGMWHRLPVDLALVSPVWVGAALWYHPAELIPAVLLLAAHACTPVRNVRTILAVDLLLRVAVSHVAPVWLIIVGGMCDAWIAERGRRLALYDTPTDELVRATMKPTGPGGA